MASNTNIEAQIVGTSPVLRDAVKRLGKVARVHKIPVLIEGETGTGKELAAQLVHGKSGRHGQMLAINCAAIPKDLLESELFGYARGAFSGAHREHVGLFERANGGTLFLDEIGELPLELQPKVLRAIQEGEVRRIGSSDTRKVDVRIVAATHRDLVAMVEAGEFREDLFYRLRGYAVCLPPLRDRGRDVLLLARLFLGAEFAAKRIGRDAEAALLEHDWPGNVRELQNVILAAAVDSGRTIHAAHVLRHAVGITLAGAAEPSRTDTILGAFDALGAASAGDIRDATGLSRSTLRRALCDLLAAGIVLRTGEGRGARYRRTASVDPVQISARQRLIVRHVEDAGRITRNEAAETTGASVRTASRDLAELVEAGVLVGDGRPGNASGYVLAGGHPPVSPGPQAHPRHLLEEADHDD